MVVSKRPLISLLIAVMMIGGVVAGLWATNVFGWRVWRVQEAQGFIGAALPGGAEHVQFTTRNQHTRIVWLRFNLPADTDLAPFLTQMGMNDGPRDGFTPFPAANPQEAAILWWQPSASPSYSGVYWNNGSKIIEVLVDKGDSSQSVIYLRAYALGQQ